jgi:large repetitive protein
LSSNVATKGRIIEWDAPSTSTSFIATGQILKQTTSAFSTPLSGGYVFGVAGEDYSGPHRMSCTGVMTGSGGTFSNGEQDCNEDGTTDHETGMTGSYTSLDASGRGTASIVSSHGTSHVAVYMVSSSKLLMVGTDPQTGTPVYSGEMRSQSGTFGNSSLNAKAIFYLTGLDLNGGSVAQQVDIGTFTGNGAGSGSVTVIEDDAGTLTQQPPFTCTYSVASNGRVTLSGGCGGNNNPVLYLTAVNTGLMEGTGNSVESGQFEPQTGGPFTTNSLSGTFFMGTAMVAYQAESVVASVSLTNGTATGLSDDIGASGQTEGNVISGNITISSDGSFSTEGGLIPNAYVISPSKFVVIDASSQPTTSILLGEK